jgi:hypothetical protein
MIARARLFLAIGTWFALWISGCSGSGRLAPRKAVTAALAHADSPLQIVPGASEGKAREPKQGHKSAKTRLKPGASDLHVVHVDGDQLLRTNLQTGESTPLGVGKVVAARQDGEGHWWVVRAQGEKHALVRIPLGFKLREVKVLVDDVPGDSGHFGLHFPDTSELKLTSFSAFREATMACGGWSGQWLCDEAMGWTSRSTWTWKPSAVQLNALGLAIPKPALKSKVTRAPLSSPLSRVPCTCYGPHYTQCGSTTPMGNSGWKLMLTSVECGDLPHHSCVVQAADESAYSAFSGEEFSADLQWIPKAVFDAKIVPFGSCGPFYMTQDGDWISDGSGTFCTLGGGTVCTPPLKGDYLGTAGEALQVIHLP